MKTKSTYLQNFCLKQIESVAPVTIRKQSDISHPVLTNQQNRKHILLKKE